jgi:hypothetical protein
MRWARQDTVTQLIACVRRVAREVLHAKDPVTEQFRVHVSHRVKDRDEQWIDVEPTGHNRGSTADSPKR